LKDLADEEPEERPWSARAAQIDAFVWEGSASESQAAKKMKKLIEGSERLVEKQGVKP
jgi:hypothetical protein